MRHPRLTRPEALAAIAVSLLAAIVTVSYVWARIARLSPFAMLGCAVAIAIIVAIALLRGATRDRAGLVAFCIVLLTMGGWLLWIARPSFLPAGGGPDLTHHLMLVDFIERNWRLPDATLASALGEMAHYTPGLHLLVALSGAWTGTNGLVAIYVVVAALVAIKAALLFLIALRVVRDGPTRVPVALSAVVLLLLPRVYFLDSVVHDSFLAQAAAETFAVAMWWALVVFDEDASKVALWLFAAAGVGTFLTWPIWIGPPLVALAATVLTHDSLPLRARLRALAVAVGPIALIAAIHAAGRAGWIGMAGTTGAVLRPSVDAFRWPFLVLAGAGLLVALVTRRARTTLLFTFAIVAQAATLDVVARAQGATTPYMALKMAYLLIYPLAVLGALGIARALRFVPKRETVAWVLLLLTVVTFRRPLTDVPRPLPVVSIDVYDAGRWARAHLEAACVDYLVPDADTMYWLHLAVLGNSRSSLRSADPDSFVPERAIARWLVPGGLPYAIADLRTLPKEVFNDVDVVEEFGTAAVVKRRGPSFCPDAERLARR